MALPIYYQELDVIVAVVPFQDTIWITEAVAENFKLTVNIML